MGVVPIEQIRPADRVLSQHPETGQLAFQLVLDTTIRPASPTLRMLVTGREIATTRGYLFWRVGNGWRMAQQLQSGDRLCVRFESQPDGHRSTWVPWLESTTPRTYSLWGIVRHRSFCCSEYQAFHARETIDGGVAPPNKLAIHHKSLEFREGFQHPLVITLLGTTQKQPSQSPRPYGKKVG